MLYGHVALYLLVDGHVGCFQLWDTMNNAAVNI
jgi:hypothetical protein